MNGRQLADAAWVGRPGQKVLPTMSYAESAMIGHDHLERGMHIMTKALAVDALAVRVQN